MNVSFRVICVWHRFYSQYGYVSFAESKYKVFYILKREQFGLKKNGQSTHPLQQHFLGILKDAHIAPTGTHEKCWHYFSIIHKESTLLSLRPNIYILQPIIWKSIGRIPSLGEMCFRNCFKGTTTSHHNIYHTILNDII